MQFQHVGGIFLSCQSTLSHQAAPQITTQRLSINYNCLTDSLGLFLTNSFNLNYHACFLPMLYHTTVPFSMAYSSCFSPHLTSNSAFFYPKLSLCLQILPNLFLPSYWPGSSLLANERNTPSRCTKRLFHSTNTWYHFLGQWGQSVPGKCD